MSRTRFLPLLLPILALAACDGAEVAAGDSLEGPDAAELQVVAEELDTPWEIRFLSGGDLLVTERPGRLVRIALPDGSGPGEVVESHDVPDVEERGEGGLMGLALHPEFPEAPWIYLCHTSRSEGLVNRLVRFRYENGQLSDRQVLLPGMPASAVHDGCRLEFGPDGHLFLTMGDASEAELAQDTGSLAGKILRLTEDGEAAPGNPFGTRVWSMGHRNAQGLAFDDEDRLWSTEHGPSGMGPGRDELNLVVAGENYGWPEITGAETGPGLVAPVIQSGNDTWAPAGLAFVGGRLFFAGLRGQALYEVPDLPPGTTADEARAGDPSVVAHFRGELGRLRPVRTGPDGRLYFGTSNRDGRGDPAPSDDRIFALRPDAP